jgi:RNA polymerase sigma-70 factor, ECF subfamily
MEHPPGPDDFRRLFHETNRRVYAFVRRYCDESDCDDLIAEVYLAAWRHFDQLPVEALPWLLGTARKVLANHWRSRGRRQRLAAEMAGISQLATADCATQAVDRADLVAALRRLRDEDREILLLIGWDGLDSTQAAQVLHCSPQAARARLSRARARFTEQLNGSEFAPEAALHLVAKADLT